jgi:hypothetical protein
MSEQTETTLRVPLMRRKLNDWLLRPTRDLIEEEVAPLKRRIDALEREVAEIRGKLEEERRVM